MKIGEEEVKNLIATFTSPAKQRFQTTLDGALSALPSTPVLAGESLSHFKVQLKLSVFFLQLFDQVAEERHRHAFEKIQRMAWQ